MDLFVEMMMLIAEVVVICFWGQVTEEVGAILVGKLTVLHLAGEVSMSWVVVII